MLARFGETWVVTRSNNRSAIEAGLSQLAPDDRPHFLYEDLPSWARVWKRGRRGIHLYYLLWQLAALRRARVAHRHTPFDLVWHVTMANVWLGTTAPLLGVPFVFGPVGGGVSVPWRMMPVLGVRGTVNEIGRSAVRGVARYLNPLARIAWRRATLILVQNEETERWLPSAYRDKAAVFPNVVLNGRPRAEGDASSRTALFAGRLVPWKGGALAIRTLAALPGWTLVVCGIGSDRPRLVRLARRMGIEDRVRFVGEVPRERLLELMAAEVDVLLFPSLREEAGWAVAEALSCGLPVVCLELGGPPLLGARPVPVSEPGRCVEALAAAVGDVTGSLRPSPQLSSDVLGRRLATLLGASFGAGFERVGGLPLPGSLRRSP
jgi:glycosyltransferase involved in cell wall biosynthesis